MSGRVEGRGQIGLTGQRQGIGSLVMPDGLTYVGDWADGQINGNGKLTQSKNRQAMLPVIEHFLSQPFMTPAIGDALTSHPEVDMISFTGSEPVGVQIQQDAAPTVKRVGLELGGKDPAYVREDADLAHAVELIRRHDALADTRERARHFAQRACDALSIFSPLIWMLYCDALRRRLSRICTSGSRKPRLSDRV